MHWVTVYYLNKTEFSVAQGKFNTGLSSIFHFTPKITIIALLSITFHYKYYKHRFFKNRNFDN